MLRFLTAGESHGPGLVTIVEGLPAGLEVTVPLLACELTRRRVSLGRGNRAAIETDQVEVLGGVRFGRTLGGPVAVLVRNREWPEWQETMSPFPGSAKPVTRPRPGHADLPGMLKYDTHDARDVLERASARETAARAVAGTLAATLLRRAAVEVLGHVVQVGAVRSEGAGPGLGDRPLIESSSVRCLDQAAAAAMVIQIEQARREGDTLGGVVEVLAFGVPPGVGSHVHWDRRLDGLLAAALMSIPGIKAVEVGDGIAGAAQRGAEAHGEIAREGGELRRLGGGSGGIEGGMSNGQTIRLRAAMKPLSTLASARTVDIATGEPAPAVAERSDVCAVPSAAVVAEHMTAWVLAAEMTRMFGGDTVDDFTRAVAAYRGRVAGF